MEIKKCSSKNHEKIEAKIFCQECNIYMCNKCQNIHTDLCQNHHTYYLNSNEQEIFTGICQEQNHLNKLEYFCKTHNILCCAACIAKIKHKGNGIHSDCDLCIIEDIEKEKKNNLQKNIKYLKDLSGKLTDSINELKKLFEKITSDKENLKMEIQKIFTEIRNAVNEREDQLLLDVDNKFDEFFFKEDFIKESEKLPSKVKLSLKKGEYLDNSWNNKDKLNSIIKDCINIEINIENIEEINTKIEKNKSLNININFYPINTEYINKDTILEEKENENKNEDINIERENNLNNNVNNILEIDLMNNNFNINNYNFANNEKENVFDDALIENNELDFNININNDNFDNKEKENIIEIKELDFNNNINNDNLMIAEDNNQDLIFNQIIKDDNNNKGFEFNENIKQRNNLNDFGFDLINQEKDINQMNLIENLNEPINNIINNNKNEINKNDDIENIINERKKELENDNNFNIFIKSFQYFGFLGVNIKFLLLGLENSGKTEILYRLKNIKEKMIQKTHCKVENIKYNIFNIILVDIGGEKKLRLSWKKHYKGTDGIIFVVDSNGKKRLKEAKDELIKIFNEEELKNCPILILANKQDLKNALSPDEIKQKLKMEQFQKKAWLIRGSNGKTGKGIKIGFDWLISEILKNISSKKNI